LNIEISIQEGLKNHQAGKLSSAEKTYHSILEKEPENVQTLFLLGTLYGQSQQYAKSIETLSRVIHLNSAHEEAYKNLSYAYELNHQMDNAVTVLEKGINSIPDSKILHNDLGDLYRKKNNTKLAIQQFRLALSINENYESAIVNLAITYATENDPEASEYFFRRALELNSMNPNTLSNYAATLNLQEKFDQAIKQGKRALEIDPNHSEALNNVGYALLKKGEITNAENLFLKAIALNPTYIDALNNLGFLLHTKGQFNDALKIYDKSVSLFPSNANSHFYRSFTNLLLGNFSIAWEDYEFGLLNNERGNIDIPLKKWAPKSDDQPLFVVAEQGVGDQIMFASCLVDLQKSNTQIVLECDPRLTPLFSRSFPNITVIGKLKDYTSQTISLTDVKHYIPIGSLPAIFRTSTDSFSSTASIPYIKSSPDLIQKWKMRYRALSNELTIGISWKAGINVDQKNRSTALADWLPLLKTKGVKFVNLQYGDVKDEIDTVEKKYGIKVHEWSDSNSLKNIDDFSAKIAALDLVISVGNTNVHIAGSQCVPAWCLIPQVPSWRWMDKGKQSIWYNSVKLYRQEQGVTWASVIDNIARDLLELVNNECR